MVCAALIAAVALNDARPAHGALLLGRREAPNRRLEGAAPPADAVGAGRFVAPPEEVLLEPTQEALRAPRVLCGCVRVFMVISEERAEGDGIARIEAGQAVSSEIERKRTIGVAPNLEKRGATGPLALRLSLSRVALHL